MFQEKSVIYPIKCLADIYGNGGRSSRRFRVIEPVCHPGGKRKESRGTGAERDEAMLRFRRRKSSRKERKKKSLQDFDRRRKKRDRTIGSAKTRGLTGF